MASGGAQRGVAPALQPDFTPAWQLEDLHRGRDRLSGGTPLHGLQEHAPRIGIAWRPSTTTALSSAPAFGIYYTMLGAIFNSLTGIHTSDNQTYGNSFDAATRTFGIVLPNTFAGRRPGGPRSATKLLHRHDPYFKTADAAVEPQPRP